VVHGHLGVRDDQLATWLKPDGDGQRAEIV
jgi:hypothetical protein